VSANSYKAHVVIVGGGFAGLACARKLAKLDNVRVTLIDKFNCIKSSKTVLSVPASINSAGDAGLGVSKPMNSVL